MCRTYSHAAPIFKKYNILNLSDINILQSACFMYKAATLRYLVCLIIILYETRMYIIILLENVRIFIYTM